MINLLAHHTAQHNREINLISMLVTIGVLVALIALTVFVAGRKKN